MQNFEYIAPTTIDNVVAALANEAYKRREALRAGLKVSDVLRTPSLPGFLGRNPAGVVLVLLVQQDPRMAMALPAAIIIGREIAVSALREFMAELGQRATVAVALVGKLKTVLQMVALLLMLLREPLFGLPVYDIGVVCLYAAVLLTLWSMVVYVRAAWPMLVANGGGGGAGR